MFSSTQKIQNVNECLYQGCHFEFDWWNWTLQLGWQLENNGWLSNTANSYGS